MEKNESIYIALDIERTGPRKSPLDKTIAIGVAWTQDFGKSYVSEILVDKTIQIPASGDWKEEWEKQKWHLKTFEEFWSKHTETLEDIIKSKRVKDLTSLNSLLESFEKNNNIITYVFDTCHYDAHFINELLSEQNFAPLHVNRDYTGYHASIDSDGFIAGGRLIDPVKKFQMKPQPHNPRDDSVSILMNYFNFQKEASKKPRITFLREQREELLNIIKTQGNQEFKACIGENCDKLLSSDSSIFSCRNGHIYCPDCEESHMNFCDSCEYSFCTNNSLCKCACDKSK